MFLYGAGGHAKVIMDILLAQGESVVAVFDDNPESNFLSGVPVMHAVPAKHPLIICVGNNAIRKKIADSNPGEFGIAIHPSAIISPSAQIGAGTVIMPGVVVNAGAKIGKHCIINSGASVDHDCVIGDFAHISPHATLCGNVHIGAGTQVGAGATIIPGIRVGEWSLVCAGTTLIKDLPNNTKFARSRNEFSTLIYPPPPNSNRSREAACVAFSSRERAFKFCSSRSVGDGTSRPVYFNSLFAHGAGRLVSQERLRDAA